MKSKIMSKSRRSLRLGGFAAWHDPTRSCPQSGNRIPPESAKSESSVVHIQEIEGSRDSSPRPLHLRAEGARSSRGPVASMWAASYFLVWVFPRFRVPA